MQDRQHVVLDRHVVAVFAHYARKLEFLLRILQRLVLSAAFKTDEDFKMEKPKK